MFLRPFTWVKAALYPGTPLTTKLCSWLPTWTTTEGESPHSPQISQGTGRRALLCVFIQAMNSSENSNWGSENYTRHGSLDISPTVHLL